MTGQLDAKELVTKIMFAFASVLVLGTSACEQSGGDQVGTLEGNRESSKAHRDSM